MARKAQKSKAASQTSREPVVSIRFGTAKFISTDVAQRQKRYSILALGDRFAAWRKFLVNGFMLLAIGLLVPPAIHGMFRSQVVIETIGMPKLLVEKGYSGDVVAHRLWDAVDAISKKAITAKEKLSFRPSSRQVKIVIPNSGISFGSVARALRSFFYGDEARIAGEFVCALSSSCEKARLTLRLRVLGKIPHVLPLDQMRKRTEEEYFREAALKLTEIVDPYMVANFHWSNKNYVEAQKAAFKVFETHPGDAKWAHNLIGLLLVQEGNNRGAIARFNLALATDAAFVIARYNLANALHSSGETSRAIAQFVKVLEIDPNFIDAHINLGSVLKDEGLYDPAILRLKLALRIEPNSVSALTLLGNTLLARGNISDAIAVHKTVLEINPKYALAWNNLGLGLLKAGDVDGAIERFEMAIKIDPKFKLALRNWGVALLAKGDTQGAIILFRSAR